MDGNAGYMRGLREHALYWRHDLTAVPAFITAENINALITEHGFAGELGILSVDIDGNDYWVLDAIDCVNPAIIICEINGVFGDLKAVTCALPAGLPALGSALLRPVFRLFSGGRAIAVRAPGLQFRRHQQQRHQCFFRSRRFGGARCSTRWRRFAPGRRAIATRAISTASLDFVRGIGRRDLVADMPVVDLAKNRLVPLSELYPLYSDSFLEEFR